MTSKVYITKTDKITPVKIKEILKKSQFIKQLKPDEKIAIKTNLLDVENKGFVSPKYMDKIIKLIESKNAKAELIDTNHIYHVENDTQYHYSNNIKQKIIDDSKYMDIEIDSKLLKKVIKSSEVDEYDKLIILTKFKPHYLIGLEGAIKTTGVDLNVKSGKIELYKQVAPFISKIGCLACKLCAQECPTKTITINSIAEINYAGCIACNYCIRVCPTDAIKPNRIKTDLLNQAIAEYMKTITQNKDIIYINILNDIRADYEHTQIGNHKIVDDIGILMSQDPVALDQASYDIINQKPGNKSPELKTNYLPGEDKIAGLWRTIDAQQQLNIAEEEKLGTTQYELIHI